MREDNYAYIIIDDLADDRKRRAVFIDPFDVPAVSTRAQELAVDEVTGCITTHHHFDHSGGNEAFARTFPQTPIWGPSNRIPFRTHPIGGGDKLRLPSSSIQASVYATPCHTRDSVCILLEDERADERTTARASAPSTFENGPRHSQRRALITADTLFVAGCGRFFEGDADDMLRALQTISLLPADALICCGHEYTLANAQFAAEVLPHCQGVRALVEALRSRQGPKITTNLYTLAQELQHNPYFLAARGDAEVLEAVQAKTPLEAVHKLREAKNAGGLQAVLRA